MKRALLIVVASTCSALCGCAQKPTCSLDVWVRKSAAIAKAHADFSTAELMGSWDGWARPGKQGFLEKRSSDGTQWMGLSVPLPAGHYQYAIKLGDLLLLDEANPQTSFGSDPLGQNADPLGTEVSDVFLSACGAPSFEDVRLSPAGADGLSLEAKLTGNVASVSVEIRRGGEVVGAPSVTIGEIQGDRIARAQIGSLSPGKYTATVSAANAETRSASAFVEVAGDGKPRELADGLVYQIMVDRFRGPGPLVAPASPGDRAGGTLAGVTEAIRAGYFTHLGVTTLWLSPVYANPLGRFPGRDGRSYEAYHGYWPNEPRAVDARLGGEAALEELVNEAHARSQRVILDAVPNHVFKDHPYYREHGIAAVGEGASWFNDGPAACVCGAPGCDWGGFIETCWFADYLPDLNWKRADVMQQGSDDLAWWMQRFDLDGLRIDAVPMMPRAATRRMAKVVRDATARQGLDGLLLGEVYTGPGQDGRDQIREYLDDRHDGLDAAFDFPSMWSMRDVIAHGASSFNALEREVTEGTATWNGSGATVAHIVGNHDTTRFLSEAAGDAGNDGWISPPAQPSREEPYRRLRVALTYALTLPGLPVLYYGDEAGLAGAGDPDSRRVMPDVLGSLPVLQAQLVEDVGRIGRARLAIPALRRGARRVLFLDADHEVVVRDEPKGEGGGAAIVVFSRDGADTARDVFGLPDGSWRDVLSDSRLDVHGGSASISLPALTAAVYVREGSPCLP